VSSGRFAYGKIEIKDLMMISLKKSALILATASLALAPAVAQAASVEAVRAVSSVEDQNGLFGNDHDWVVGLLLIVAAVGAVLLFDNNDDAPTSP